MVYNQYSSGSESSRMPWIESHTELAQHPKSGRLARRLGCSKPTAIGHLHLLWWWALEYAQDGNVSSFDAEEIAEAVMWEGEPQVFVDALRGAGFLDACGSVHDWDEYTGRLMERREREREQTRLRVQAFRARRRDDEPAGNAPSNAPVVPGNAPYQDGNDPVTRYSVTRNALRNAPVTLGNAPTVPNRTEPNPSPTERGAPDADAPVAPAKTRGNARVAAVIDALRAEGMSGTLKPADRQAITKTDYPAADVASLYAAIFRGEHGDEFMHTTLSVANCINRWMDGWQSHRAGHAAPGRKNGRPLSGPAAVAAVFAAEGVRLDH